MAKYTAGQVMPDFDYRTVYEEGCRLSKTAAACAGKTALVFLRYYGCSACQLDLALFAEEFDKITAGGGQLLVVLQSDPVKMAQKITPETFPFPIICDPDMGLYQMLSIGSFESIPSELPQRLLEKFAQIKARGFQHGEYEGNEQQLPATFILNPDMTIAYAHYGEDAGDVPTPEELAELLK